ncbi:MAG: cation:dicarboxylase symporter family transporter [Treponema sp.]|jgi:Na+/H+-dicarboxylate symporter|nr:cation:dicarboxylase symporter family transporter [Treponema sp.]
MKIWLKLFIGAVLGIVLGFLLPEGNETILRALSWLEGMAIRIGRYALVPVLFFSLTIAIYELRQDKQFWGHIFRTLLFMLGTTVFLIALGIIVPLLFTPPRIRISAEEQTEDILLGVSQNFQELFPSNMFNALTGSGEYLFPVFIFAFFLGMGLSYDRNYSKPIISLTDSLSRIFYHVTAFFSEVLSPVLIVLAAYWAVRYRETLKSGVFLELILLLGIFSAVLAFIVFPLLLYFIKPKVNPWAVLYGSLGPALAGFFSGDINFSLPVLLLHTKENLGVRRRSNTITLSLYSAFGRAGSAMVAASSFIVIINSYSSLGVTSADLFSIGLRALAISFLLARHPGDGAYTALAVLCMSYGRGYEAGYLILKPLAFYLIAAGTFLDIMIAGFSSFTLARLTGFQEDRTLRHYI